MKLKHLLLAVVAIVGMYAIVAGEPALVETVSIAGVAGYGVVDKLTQKTIALPAAAGNVTSAAIDLGHTANGANVADYEIAIVAPALTAAQLPNTKTAKYSIVTSANADLSSPTIYAADVLVQTGAGGAGAIAAEATIRLGVVADRYVGVKVVTDGAVNASAAEATVELRF